MNYSRKPPFARLEWNKQPAPSMEPVSLIPVTSVEFPLPSGDVMGFNQNSHLILGENLAVMSALLPHFEDSIDLIYCDPPFLSGKAYTARIGKNEDSRKPGEWDLASGYTDTWRDAGEYLDMLYHRLTLMYRLLSPRGTLYLHLDWHASAYARVILDEIFGPDRLLNEIVWLYHGPSPIKSAFNRKHDTILVYTKTADYIFNTDAVRVPYNPSTVKTFASSPKAGFGKKPDLERGKVPEDWWYFPVVARLHNERTGYPTQKPEALLDRIVRASSTENSIVADFFCGSGTTAATAQKNHRRWLACDNSQLAVFTTYQRLIEGSPSPFLQWTTGQNSSDDSSLHAAIHIRQQNYKTDLTLEIHEQEDAFPQLVEIDWDYNGNIFCSSSWQHAPADSLPLLERSLSFHHNYESSGTYTIAARLLDNHGRTAIVTRIITIV